MDVTPSDYAIHDAAREGRGREIETLLAANPSLRKKRDQDGRVALHWAVACSQPNVVEILLNRTDVDPDPEDELSWTPLMMASNVSDGENLAKLLLMRGADPTRKNSNGQTALHFAASKGNLDTARSLMAHKASTRVRDRRSQQPIHRAAAAGWSPMVKLLIENQSPLSVADDAGLTPLHHAIAEGRGDTALLLLRAGADSSKRDRDGKLAIDLSPDRKVRDFILTSAEREGTDIVLD